MSALSLPVTGHTQVYVSGDVVIDETAAIAPGVILQTTAKGRIIIKAGACLGMGTILTATVGTIEIGEGAILGAGVLVVGCGKIGDRCCIGSATTLIETSIASGELVSPGSLRGDPSRQDRFSTTESETINSDPWSDSSPETETEENTFNNNGHTVSPVSSDVKEKTDSTPNGASPEETVNPESETNRESDNGDSLSQQSSSLNSKIYGQTHIERLMVTLFPHKDQFKKE